MSRSHTVVVGGGVIGVATAYYLAQRGEEVTLVEQDELCSGCSQGNAGQITPGHLPLPQPGTMARNMRWLFKPTSPLYVSPRLDVQLLGWLWQFNQACTRSHLRRATEILCRLGEASRALFDELTGEVRFRYSHQGRLEVCRSEKTYQAACAEAELLRCCGFDSRRLRGAEVRQLEPAIHEEVAGAIYYPNSGFCNPQEFVVRLAAAAEASGANLRCNTQVTDLKVRRGRVACVLTKDEPIEADTFVLACGSWTPRLARRIGLPLPVQPGKGYHLDIARPPVCPAVPVVLVEERIFVTPVDDESLRLAGTMEFSGFNLKQRPARLQMLATGAGRYLAGVRGAEVRSRWCHLRPMTPDGLPIIGRAPQAGNLWIATGHGMLGLTQGPITGKLLAEWITEGQTSIDLAALRPDRF